MFPSFIIQTINLFTSLLSFPPSRFSFSSQFFCPVSFTLQRHEMCVCDRTTTKEININTMCIMFIANINFQCKPKYIYTHAHSMAHVCVRVSYWVEMQISEQFLSALIVCCLSFYPWLKNKKTKRIHFISFHEERNASEQQQQQPNQPRQNIFSGYFWL